MQFFSQDVNDNEFKMLMEEETERAENIEAEALDEARQYAVAFVWTLVGFGLGLVAAKAVAAVCKPSSPIVQLLLGLLPFQVMAPLAAFFALRGMAARKGWRQTVEWDVPCLTGRLAFRIHAVLFVLCLFCSISINCISKAVCDKLGIPFEEQSLIQMAHGNDSVLFWSIAFFSVMILAPCVEECLYRQIMFKALEGALHRRWAAVALTSLCFAAVHGIMPMVPALFALGMLFQEAKRRGGLRQSILLHSCYNGFMLALVLMFDK